MMNSQQHNRDRDRDMNNNGRGGNAAAQGKKTFRRKSCRFCADKNIPIRYNDPMTIVSFLTDRGKIIPRRVSGNCALHQREVAQAVKRARHIALIPYVTVGD